MNKDKRILLLSSRYGISNSANSICVKNIAREFQKRGYDVFVLTSSGCEEEQEYELDGVKVFALKQALYSKLLNEYSGDAKLDKKVSFYLYSILRRLLNFFIYPNVSPIRSRKIYLKAKEIISENKIKIVISTYRPYENIYTVLKLSKEVNFQLLLFDFQLDLLAESNQRAGFIKRVLNHRATKVIKQEIMHLDGLILPESARRDYTEKNNVFFSGFPVFIPDTNAGMSEFKYDTNYINIVYIGSLSIENRNPQCAFNLIKKLNEISERKYLIHVWGNIDSAINKMISQSSFVIYHGLIDNIYTMDLLERADLLLNISNEQTYNMLPSKIFQEFASMRPIINFVKNEADMSLPFFINYKFVVNIYERDAKSVDIKALNYKFQKLISEEISRPDELLRKYTPKYFVDIIERIVNGREKK